MSTAARELLDSFKSITKCRSDEEAAHFLDACGHDLATAVDLFFAKPAPPSPPRRVAPSGVGRRRPPVTGNSNPRMDIRRYAMPKTAATAPPPLAGTSGSKNGENNLNEEDVEMADSETVRAPIEPTSGILVEQSFHQSYAPRVRRAPTSSVFDHFRDFRAEANEQMNAALRQNGTAQMQAPIGPTAAPPVASKRDALQALFRPPVDILHQGNWESARSEAQKVGRWLLVNLQDVQEFACQTLNRDIWANAAVKELMKSYFVFWQVSHDSADGLRIGSYYRIRRYPAVFIVDPRTGELLVNLRCQDAVSFCDQVTTFIDSFPDFAARDRSLIGAAATSSSDPTPSSYRPDEQEPLEASLSGARKRILRNGQIEETAGEVNGIISKSAKIPKYDDGNSMPDIDALINGGEKLTTVDQDEWKHHLGEPSGVEVNLVLRLPNGQRHRISVPDSTPLHAVFLFIHGRGFASGEHFLVLSFPKRQYSSEEATRTTLAQLGFNRQELIDVERK